MPCEQTLEQSVVSLCAQAGAALAVAESCTGGLIAHRITNVPGASDVFQGGVVSYANEAKTTLLGVPVEMLATHGAVSGAVAVAMAQGVLRLLNASLAVAVTGIAGPGGGSAEKPVGTVYIAVADRASAHAELFRFTGDRMAIKEQTADAALSCLLQQLEKS